MLPAPVSVSPKRTGPSMWRPTIDGPVTRGRGTPARADEILERLAETSDRPKAVLAGELTGGNGRTQWPAKRDPRRSALYRCLRPFQRRRIPPYGLPGARRSSPGPAGDSDARGATERTRWPPQRGPPFPRCTNKVLRLGTRSCPAARPFDHGTPRLRHRHACHTATAPMLPMTNCGGGYRPSRECRVTVD